MANNNNQDKKRGFGAMDEEKHREASREGGKAAHEAGDANEFKEGDERTREAGRKGGQSSRSDTEDEELEENM